MSKFESVTSGVRPDGLSDDQKIITHEYTRGWGSRAFERIVRDIEWKKVFGIWR